MCVPEGGEYRCTYRTGGSYAVAAFSDGRPLRGRSLRCWASVGSSSLRAVSPTVIESSPLWGLPAAVELPRGKVFDVYRAIAVSEETS